LWEDTSTVLHEMGAFGEVLGSVDPTFDSPELPAALVRTLASGEMDELTGRFIGVHDDLQSLREIVRRDPSSDVGRLRIVRPTALQRQRHQGHVSPTSAAFAA
jgi:hypothetical protein